MSSVAWIVMLMVLWILLFILAKFCYNYYVLIKINQEFDQHVDAIFRDIHLMREGREAETETTAEHTARFDSIMSRYLAQQKKLFWKY